MHSFKSGHPDKVYLGNTKEDFIAILRYYNHISFFKNDTQINKTTLAKYVRENKQKHNITHALKWYIIRSVPSYSSITKSCMLWLHEKFLILTYSNQNELLNKKVLFLNVVMLICIFFLTIKLMIDILFNTFLVRDHTLSM